MRTPLVGIVAYHLPPGRVTKWDRGAFAVPENCVAALRRAATRPVLLTGSDADPAEALEPFDGLLLAGGGDVEPSRYGGAAHPEVYGVDGERDGLEIGLVRAAADRRLPTLAICRGIQILNVAFGGTLHQHVPEVPGLSPHGMPRGAVIDPVMHDVKVAEGSRLLEATGQLVQAARSSHHQAVDRLGQRLVAVGWTGDGLIEAVEHEDGWMIGVQWHPEETANTDPAQQAQFDAQGDRARSGSRD